jgi:hypothetical protein
MCSNRKLLARETVLSNVCERRMQSIIVEEIDWVTGYSLAVLLSRVVYVGPPLWFGGQSSWLQIRRPGYDSRLYQKKKM